MPDDSGLDFAVPASVTSMLDRAIARYGDRPAMRFMGRRWTYQELGRMVERAARGLQNIGVGRGVRVGLCLPNLPYTIVYFHAALKAGATVVNYNPLYVERELDFQIRDSGTTVMVAPDVEMICAKLRAVAAASGLRTLIVCPMAGILPFPKSVLYGIVRRREIARVPADGLHRRHDALTRDAAAPEPVAIDPENDVAVLQYTGGTTGVPKGAMLTHANLTANTRQVVRHMPSIRRGEERMMAVLPFFHVFAMTSVMNYSIEIGAEIILHPRFVIEDVLRSIVRDKPTLFPAVPTIYAAINVAQEKKPIDLGSIRACISGGAPLPGDVRERFEKNTGCKLVEGYGLTEASPVVCCNPPDGHVKDGSVGVPVRGTTIEIRSLDNIGTLLAAGERGEVCVRGPQVMKGYWGRPDETDRVLVEGALRTGDVGYLDEDGYLFIVDRLKDLIICGGYNVYPRVLEEALYQHPAVAEAIVIGVPDAYRGQAPKAFVTLRANAAATSDELKEFLAGYVSKIEMPREIEIRTTLPKTMIGKLSKKELVEEERAKAA